MPDGTDVSFPDDMPSDKIKDMISKKFPNEVAGHLSDMASAIRSGMSWGDVAKNAVSNIPSSTGELISSIAQPVIHPVDTAENVASVGKGIMQKIGLMSGSDSEKYADAVGRFFLDRYGSVDNIKQTIAKDPVGVLADVATVFTGGETALARAPAAVAKVGEVAGKIGRAVDPLTAAGKVAKFGGGVAAQALGISTGAGADAFKVAARAGAEGGEAGKSFLDNLTGKADMGAVVQDAKNAVGQLRSERGDIYRQEMAKIGADNTVLNFDKILDASDRVDKVKSYKGQSLSPSTEAIRDNITNVVLEWSYLDPKQFHTAEGLDALKQKIGDIRDATQHGTPERVVADQVYNSIKDTITKQAPEYAKVMKGYQDASDLIKEMEKTLSLNPKASVDTQLRKLQSVLRNNVSTNYGRRAELVDFLQRAGAPNLIEKLSGQTLSSLAPRGLSRLLAGGEGLSAAGAAMFGNPAAAAGLTGGLIASSPALMGGAAYGAGVASRFARPLGQSAFQIGRFQQ